MQIKDFPGGENLKNFKPDGGTGIDKVEHNKPDSVKHNESGGFAGDKKSSPENNSADNIHRSAAYKKFLEMLQSGETSRDELAFFAWPDKTMQQVSRFFNTVFPKRNSNGAIEKLAARLLIKEIDSGQVQITQEYNEPLDNTKDVLAGYVASLKKENEVNKENKLASKSPRQSEIYDFLCQMYVKGMTREQMKAEFFGKPEDIKLAPEAKEFITDPKWKDTLKLFLRDLNPPEAEVLTAKEVNLIAGGPKTLADSLGEGKFEKIDMRDKKENPAARLLTKIILAQPGLAEKNLEQADWQEVSEKLVQGLKDVWQDFYYSGRWHYDDKNKEYVLTDEADLDARVSLYLFAKAGLKKVLGAQALPPGEMTKPGTAFDLGKHSGVRLQKNEDGQALISLDNHQPGRGFETSSAKIIFNLLSEGGLLKPNYQLRALVEMTVDDDNGRLLNDLAQYEKSSQTMRGLQRFCSPQRIINFFTKYWQETAAKINNHNGDKGRLIYQAILDRELTPEDIKEFDLARAVDSQARHIKRAQTMFFTVPEAKLIKEGRLINTRLGKCVVNIEAGDKSAKRFNVGHDAVKVDPRGFKLYLSYDAQGNSILLNTTNRQIDLYEEFKSFLTQHQDLAPVRGALLIKPHDGKQMSFEFTDVLNELGYDISKAQGLVREFLEKQGKIEPLAGPVPVAASEVTPRKESSKTVAIEPTKVKESSAVPAGEKKEEVAEEVNIKLGPAFWWNKESDFPVILVGPIHKDKQGKFYVEARYDTEKYPVDSRNEFSDDKVFFVPIDQVIYGHSTAEDISLKDKKSEKLVTLDKAAPAVFEYNGLKFNRELTKEEKAIAKLTNLEKVLQENLPKFQGEALVAIKRSPAEYTAPGETSEQAVSRIVEQWKTLYREKECKKLGLPIIESTA